MIAHRPHNGQEPPGHERARELVRERFGHRITASQRFFDQHAPEVSACASAMADRFFDGATLIIFGSGLRATDAQHNSVEYVHPALPGCRALPALSLTTDAATLTGILLGDDRDDVFAHQLRVLGGAGDIALAFAELPVSASVRRGMEAARERGMLTIALLDGPDDGSLVADHVFEVEEPDPLVAQELHLATYHILWELVHIVLNHRGIGTAPPAGGGS
ncbi:MAG TPA: SIS domain-containing protein [Candidatus Dormibacteraeota bacterium]|jgi:D-sedoheptulose 7-phosphate isomerase|nr:SIS domain-containing protein [Candidatus Dormibacteraeota bacterium]